MTKQHSIQALTATNKANLDAIKSLAATSLKATERFTALNLDMARGSINLGAEYVQQVSGDSLQNLVPKQDESLKKTTDQANAYLRGAMDILSETQAEITEVTSSRVHEFNNSMTSWLDTVAQSGPAGSEIAVSAVKSAIANANSMYNHILQATQKGGAGKHHSAAVTKIAA